MKNSLVYLLWIGVSVAIAIITISAGEIDSGEAKKILDSSLQGFYKLLNTIILSTATLLTLILTYVGITADKDELSDKIKSDLTRTIAVTTAVIFSLAILLFFWVNSPLHESIWESTGNVLSYYYAIVILTAVLIGLLLTVITLITKLIINVLNRLDDQSH